MSLLKFTKWMQCTAEHGHVMWTAISNLHISVPLWEHFLRGCATPSTLQAPMELPQLQQAWPYCTPCSAGPSSQFTWERLGVRQGVYELGPTFYHLTMCVIWITHSPTINVKYLFRKKTPHSLHSLRQNMGKLQNLSVCLYRAALTDPVITSNSQCYLLTQSGRLCKWPKAGKKTQSSDRPQISPDLLNSTDSRLKGPKVFWELKIS